MRTMQGSGSRLSGALVILAALVIAGCQAPSKRLNAPPQGHTEYPHEMQCTYTPMVDNALLADMTMSSVNFVPHQSELNATGVRRLLRYAEIMKTYGGTLHYDGVRDEKRLAQDRMKRIEDFLVNAGLEKSEFKIERGMAGGAGMDAGEALTIRQGSRAKVSQGGGQQSQGMGEALKQLTGGGSTDKKP